MLSGFRDFIARGNVIDLAVAVVIGAAFGALVTSFTTDILTPLLGLVGVPDFRELSFTTPGGAVVSYGNFLNALISFLLIAAAIYFFVVAPLNALEARRQRGREETPTTKTCPECASEIAATARRCPMCTQPQPAT
ncbi:MAG TPA: large conductance mechanosensitive channel protein MscL [Candidatus Limnocylindria bacterium]|nr:large conductance mechanosensitive channel protein MscL [Candidatus Limnocylindria bacterium]